MQPSAASYLNGISYTQNTNYSSGGGNTNAGGSAASLLGVTGAQHNSSTSYAPSYTNFSTQTNTSNQPYNPQTNYSNGNAQTNHFLNFSNSPSPQSSNSSNSLPSYLSGIEVNGPTGMGVSGGTQSPNYQNNFSSNSPSSFASPNVQQNYADSAATMMGIGTPMQGPSPSYMSGFQPNPPQINVQPPLPLQTQYNTTQPYFANVSAPVMNPGPYNGAIGFPQMNSGYCGPPPMNTYGNNSMPGMGSHLPVPMAPGMRSSGAHNIATGGKRRALVIGINYIRCRRGKLKGCINDAHNMSRFMAQHFGFTNIRLMTDDLPPNSPDHPTKSNLISAFNWLVADAKPGDSFFFHFSGHGGQSEDKTHLEDDGLNETILPADWETVGMIIDDDLHDMLVRGLPEGARFTAIFDSCHSGTALDLPYVYKVQYGQFKNAHKAEEDRFWGRHKAKMEEKKSLGLKALTSHVTGEVSHQVKKRVRNGLMKKLNTTRAIVVMFSGCRDDQTSADTTMSNQATGAMSYSFIQTLNTHQGVISYADLLAGMRDVLHNGTKQFTQLPQLSYGRPMDMSQDFVM